MTLMAEGGDSPPPGAGDLCHEPVDVEPVQKPAHLPPCRLRSRLSRMQVAVRLARRSRFVKPRTACSPLMSAAKSWQSGRATGLKALVVRPVAACLRVVIASSPRRPAVGVVDRGQDVEIPRVPLQRKLAVAKAVGHTLP